MTKQTRLLNYSEPRVKYNQGKRFSMGIWRKKILERDKGECQNCLSAISDPYRQRTAVIEAHHVVPRHHGGLNTLDNGISLCTFCHDYFDLMYFICGLDYYEVINEKPTEKRMKEIKELMEKRYYLHLINLIV